MAQLSIERYDQREHEARVLASYPAIRAFSPTSFLQANFPARVTEEYELRRYADIMYETLSRQDWLNRKIYAPDEITHILKLSGQIEALTERLYGAPVRPLMCLFTSLPLVRMVEYLARKVGRRLTVLEVGLGSGHLSAYLVNLGHKVVGMEVCQALYLWQNRLFDAIAPGGLDEWASAPVNVAAEFSAASRFTHVPWWRFARFHETMPINADIVICDATLGEMDHFAFRYFARIAKMLAQRSDVGCLMLQNIGEERVHQRAHVDQMLADLGFKLVRVGATSVFIGSDRFQTGWLDGLHEPPPWGANGELKSPIAFLPPIERLLESYKFFEFIGLGK